MFSFLFHLLLVGFMLAASSLAWLSGNSLTIGVLPWQGAALIPWLFFTGLAGLVVTLLAWKRILPVLFLLWNVAVLAMLVRGFFFSAYNFGPGGGSLSTALYLTLAALVAACGSGFHLSQPEPGARRRAVLV